MFMPFFRLVAIYAVVILAIVAFFQRDKVMELVGFGAGTDAVEAAAPAAGGDDTDNGAMAETSAPVSSQPQTQTPAVAVQPQSGALAIVQPTPDRPASESTQPMQSALNLSDRLTEARQTYWSGDQAKAEQLYRALVEESPNDPDLHGELGNILYGQGRYQDAAESYLTAGELLAGAGNLAQVQPIIGILQAIAPQKAAALRSFAAN